MNKYKILITTTNSLTVAKKIQQILINKKLAPCVHTISNIESSYLWEGKLVSDKEIIIIIKSLEKYTSDIKETLTKIHNYTVPELLSLDFDIVNDKYAKWFNENINNI